MNEIKLYTISFSDVISEEIISTKNYLHQNGYVYLFVTKTIRKKLTKNIINRCLPFMYLRFSRKIETVDEFIQELNKDFADIHHNIKIEVIKIFTIHDIC